MEVNAEIIARGSIKTILAFSTFSMPSMHLLVMQGHLACSLGGALNQ